MSYGKRRSHSYETICIERIEKGINSIKSGRRTGEEVGQDLEFFFNKLEDINKEMYEDLHMQYCIARLESQQSKEIKEIHS
jgi:hypothetical protein